MAGMKLDVRDGVEFEVGGREHLRSRHFVSPAFPQHEQHFFPLLTSSCGHRVASSITTRDSRTCHMVREGRKRWIGFGRVLVDWRAAHLLSLEEVLSLSLQQNALPLLPQALQAQADRGYTLQDWQHICCEEEGGPRCCRASEGTQHEEVRRHGSHHTRA